MFELVAPHLLGHWLPRIVTERQYSKQPEAIREYYRRYAGSPKTGLIGK